MYKLFDKWLFQVNYYVKDRVEQIELSTHVTRLTEDEFQLQLDAQEQYQRNHTIRIINIWPESDNLLQKTVDLWILLKK